MNTRIFYISNPFLPSSKGCCRVLLRNLCSSILVYALFPGLPPVARFRFELSLVYCSFFWPYWVGGVILLNLTSISQAEITENLPPRHFLIWILHVYCAPRFTSNDSIEYYVSQNEAAPAHCWRDSDRDRKSFSDCLCLLASRHAMWTEVISFEHWAVPLNPRSLKRISF